jgi:hypothetical protein
MTKTFTNILATCPWVAHIDDERNEGNSIIVTLDEDYVWDDEKDCGVRGFNTASEVLQGTRRNCVFRTTNN